MGRYEYCHGHVAFHYRDDRRREDGLPMLTGVELAVAIAIVAAGGVVLGTVSFGLGSVAAPVLLILLGAKPTVVIVNTFIVVQLSLVLSGTWRQIEIRTTKWMILGGICAAPIGVFVLNVTAPSVLRIAIGVVIVVMGLLSLRETKFPLATFPGSGIVYGFATCLTTTAISIGGPLGGIYAVAQRWPTQTARAALALMFSVSSLLAVVLFALTGLYTRDTLINTALLLPGLLAGFGIAKILVGRLNHQAFRRAVIVIVVLAGCMLLARELVG